jgi:NADP-dependent 3-hydroxy-3-methylglutaryl-CoA reductase
MNLQSDLCFEASKSILTTEDKVPKGNSHNQASLDRRIDWFKEKYDFELSAILNHQIEPRRLRGVIENFIGTVHIPVGLAGPLRINGEFAKGVYFAPFATVEGVITLSASRGARVINESGGIRTKIFQRQMIRAPYFQFRNLDECEIFIRWIKHNHNNIEAECNKLSRHGRLERIEEYIIGNSVHLKFCFSTGDAAGQNMVTIMTDNGTIWIRKHFEPDTGVKIRFYAVEGNLAGDKKFNFMNLNSDTASRGARVFTEVFLKKDAIEDIFNCSLENFLTEANNGNIANLVAGTPGGLSVNAVNVIAALYAATGQDLGCVYESGSQHIYFEGTDDGIYWSSTFSSIVTGTISNAQRLPTQKECLSILGCHGENSASKLAEIIAAFSVALDISTLASVANDTFSRAHRICGRG